jgi:hypothetical protein
MNTMIPHAADTPWQRAKMEQITRADVAAFQGRGPGMANAIVEQSGIRIGEERRRGRGAGVNPSGRFEPVSRHVFDDGWSNFEELPPFKTEVQVERPRQIITRNESPDISFDRSINPYRGCRSPSAPTPIPTSRSRNSGGSCAKSLKCWKRASIRSASSPSRRW